MCTAEELGELKLEICQALQTLHNVYGRSYGRQGEVEYWLWINNQGMVEHAIVDNYQGESDAFLENTINKIEGWKFTTRLTGNGVFLKQKIRYRGY